MSSGHLTIGRVQRHCTTAVVAGLVLAGTALAGCDTGTTAPSPNSPPTSSPQPSSPAPSSAAPSSAAPSSAASPPAAPSSSRSVSGKPKAPSSPTPVPKNANDKRFDSKNFPASVASPNPYFPLVAGQQTLRDGSINRGSRKLHHRRRVTVTDVTKEIDGVRTVLVLDEDIDQGQVSEAALDYYAQDNNGNVWYLGSYTEIYEGGEFVNAVDAWQTGTQGAKAGVIMMARPTEGQRYVEMNDSRETIRAKVSKVGARKCVPFRCFPNALVVLEDGTEFKYYGSGVGDIGTEPNYSGGEQEREELINAVQLTPKGLAEKSSQAMAMDRHARKTAAQVFAKSAKAQRS